ncbi:MAG: type II toxin-antitoxin system HicB family antitoxin [Solidesulfovibrio sp. DCME]|uniref:type II toxin-antitoxin system HicB family antitoxin n=1 Tax=Solidesulfovibrio sp. DCME TaxID=3447380 RepID=UPI003D0A3FD0
MDMDFHGYPFNLTPLSEEDGGGWLIVFPDFPGAVMSDGETPEEALANGRDALEGVIAVYREDGRELPAPGSGGPASGKFNLRTPKSLHAKLAKQAEAEGVSMNTLAVALLAEGLGVRLRAKNAGVFPGASFAGTCFFGPGKDAEGEMK